MIWVDSTMLPIYKMLHGTTIQNLCLILGHLTLLTDDSKVHRCIWRSKNENVK